MAAVTGILVTELLGATKWWEAGAQSYSVDLVPLVSLAWFTCDMYAHLVQTQCTAIA